MPSSRDYKLDMFLTSFALGYKPQGTIADIVCPRIPVGRDSGKYNVFGSEGLKGYDTARAPKSDPNLITWKPSSDTYACVAHSLGDFVDDLDRERAGDIGFDARQETVQVLMDAMVTDLEKQVATLFQTYTNYASGCYETLSGTDQFDSDGGGPDIEKLIDDADAVVRGKCGMATNTLVIPYEVAKVMKRNAKIQKHRENIVDLTQVGFPPTLYGKNIIIAGAQEDTANAGQTMSLSDIWSDKLILMYLNPNPGWKGMAFAKNFTYGKMAFEVISEMVSRSRKPHNTEYIEVFEAGRDSKVTHSGAAYLWIDVLAG